MPSHRNFIGVQVVHALSAVLALLLGRTLSSPTGVPRRGLPLLQTLRDLERARERERLLLLVLMRMRAGLVRGHAPRGCVSLLVCARCGRGRLTRSVEVRREVTGRNDGPAGIAGRGRPRPAGLQGLQRDMQRGGLPPSVYWIRTVFLANLATVGAYFRQM